MILRNGKVLFIDGDEKRRKKIELDVDKRRKIYAEEEAQGKVIVVERKKIDAEEEVAVTERKKIDAEEEVAVTERKKIDAEEVENQSIEAEKCHLPDDLITENILTRLPFRDLAATCSGVSKLWYNLIYNDNRFATTHSLVQQNQKNYDLFLHFLDNRESCYIFRLAKNRHNNSLNMKFFLVRNFQFKYELVGYCNGLTCYGERELVDGTGSITVVNLTTLETLGLRYITPHTRKYNHLCHGFGVDPLSQVYKVVLIYTSKTNDRFLCIVITLGTSPPWRKITTSTAEMLPPPGSSPFPSPMVTRVSTNFCGSVTGTLCGGDLFWRVTNEGALLEDNINESHRSGTEMLLSFNLHDEKIQFIRLPPQSTMNEHPCLVLDHLLEFEGYPCVARSEKMMMLSNNDQHRCKDKGSCSCCKVHLFILKDKGKQVWIPAKTFDVRVRDQGLLTSLLSCYSGAVSTTSPPARISTVSDQVLLYWFNGEYLLFYNLETRHLEAVKGSPYHRHIFQSKIAAFGSDDSAHRPYMDCLLQAQVENIVSLKTFIPDGEIISTKCLDDFLDLTSGRSLAGWVTSGRASPEYHGFF